MTSPCFFKVRRTGFSLIQLLFMLVIIAILAALILPSLKNALATANSAKCTSNLRQLQIAATTYEVDNHYPLGMFCPIEGGGGVEYWMLAIASQLGYPVPFIVGARPTGILACPASTFTVQANYYGSDYAKNGRFNIAPVPNSDLGPFQLASTISRPSTVLFFGDVWYPQPNTDHPAGLTPYVVDGFLHFLHKGRANVVFYDGHVESLKPGDLPSGVDGVPGNPYPYLRPPWVPGSN